MNVLTLLGSPRSDGNTDRILAWVERALRDGKHGAERFHLNALEIRDCAACYACAESEHEPGCALTDDAQMILKKMINADAVVFASPLYMWGVSGPMKQLYDRCLCLVRGWGGADHRSFVNGTRIAQLITCGGAEVDNPEAAETVFDRLSEFLKADNRGTFVFAHCTEPQHLPNSHGALARELAERLTE
jgi:multimeric flavodoxin WrbA